MTEAFPPNDPNFSWCFSLCRQACGALLPSSLFQCACRGSHHSSPAYENRRTRPSDWPRTPPRVHQYRLARSPHMLQPYTAHLRKSLHCSCSVASASALAAANQAKCTSPAQSPHAAARSPGSRPEPRACFQKSSCVPLCARVRFSRAHIYPLHRGPRDTDAGMQAGQCARGSHTCV